MQQNSRYYYNFSIWVKLNFKIEKYKFQKTQNSADSHRQNATVPVAAKFQIPSRFLKFGKIEFQIWEIKNFQKHKTAQILAATMRPSRTQQNSRYHYDFWSSVKLNFKIEKYKFQKTQDSADSRHQNATVPDAAKFQIPLRFLNLAEIELQNKKVQNSKTQDSADSRCQNATVLDAAKFQIPLRFLKFDKIEVEI